LLLAPRQPDGLRGAISPHLHGAQPVPQDATIDAGNPTRTVKHLIGLVQPASGGPVRIAPATQSHHFNPTEVP